MNRSDNNLMPDDISSDESSSDNSDDEESLVKNGEHEGNNKEFWQKKAFVKKCNLFRNWSSKMRHQCESSLQKESFHFDATLTKQGSDICRLYFIISGQCRLVVDPAQHRTQFPKLLEHIPKQQDERELSRTRPRPPGRHTCLNEHVKVRRHAGYAAAERRLNLKTRTLCYVDEGDVLGDIETIFGLDTHIHTAVCTANTEVLSLDRGDLEKLIFKRNTTTMDVLRDTAEEKVHSRAKMREGCQVELYRFLKDKVPEARTKRRPPSGRQPDDNRPRSVMDTIQDRGTMMTQLSKMFIQDKVPFIEPSVPGALYYLNKSAERAEKRSMMKSLAQNKRNHSAKTGEVRLQRARRRAQRQARSRRELERLTLGSESQDVQKLKDDDHAINRYLTHNMGTSKNIASQLGEPDDESLPPDPINGSESDQVNLTYKDITNTDVSKVVVDMGDKQQASNANRAKIICSMIEKKASQHPSPIEQLTRPKSAPAPFNYNYNDEKEEEEIESFDWETSDKALKSLEQKLRIFHSVFDGSDKGTKSTSQISAMKRFTIQGPEDVPIPGGSVYVKQRQCEYPGISQSSQHHQHIRRFMIPKNAYRVAVRTLSTVGQQGQAPASNTRTVGFQGLRARTQSAPAKRQPTFY